MAPTVNVREKANNMLAWTVSTRENGVAPTVNTRERTVTTPAEEQILTMKNCPEEMQMLNPRDWQGGKMPRSSRGGGGAARRRWNWLMHYFPKTIPSKIYYHCIHKRSCVF